MKIGFDAKRAFVNTSGLGNYSRFTINALAKLFPQDNYVLYTPKKNEAFLNFYGQSTSVQVIEPAGVWRKFSSLWRVFKLASVTKQQQLDIYHGLSNELPTDIRRHVSKAVVTIHDLIFIRHPELFRPVDRLIYKNKFRSACKNAHRIIAISEQTKQDIIHYYNIDPSKIEVIYQDCDPVFHQVCDPNMLQHVRQKYALPDKYLLNVGTLEPRKNQLNLLKAWHLSGTKLDLVFIGKKTPYAEKLVAYMNQHELGSKVHFMPYIPFNELPAFYQMATIFAYPSLFEGFGIPIVEALNSGVPVITSTGSCFSEAGGDAAIYVDPDNVKELASTINKVSQDEELRTQMIQQGYEHVLKFRPEHTITQLHNLYKRLLEV